MTATANGIGGTYTVTVQAAGAKDVPLTLTNLVPSITPPTVVNLQRFGFHLQPTSIVLTFSEPMDPIRAEALGNYTLVEPGRGHSRVIPLKAARYNGAAQTVTLFPSQLLNLHLVYQITVNGMAPLGLTNTSGVLLDGQGNGQPGTNFVAILRGFGLDKPGVPFNKLIRDQLGGKPISSRRVNPRLSGSVSRQSHPSPARSALQTPKHSLREERLLGVRTPFRVLLSRRSG